MKRPMIKRIFMWIGIVALASGTLYAFEATRVPCQEAIRYSIGQFDTRFGITESEFRLAIAEAEQPWETALGRDIFRYEVGTALPVNLIFDERQARTIDGQKLKNEWESLQSTQATIQGKYKIFLAELAKARQDYDAAVVLFERQLERYNNRVNEWNESDRTDEDEIDWIRAEEKKLRQNQATLETKRARVNSLVAEVNRYAKEEEKVVDRYNEQVNDFTEIYGTEGSFDQGTYGGAGIDIYQFDDRDHLVMVLTHELGHALGLGHVANPRSIMFSMISEQDVRNISLSVEDQAALRGVCSVTAWDLSLRDLRSLVRILTGNKA